MTVANMMQTFRQMDADKNGKLSATEMKRGIATANNDLRGLAAQNGGAAGLMAALNTNRDASVSAKEWQLGLAQLQNQSATALLQAQEAQSPLTDRFAGVLKGGLYATMPSVSAPDGGVAQNVLAAYLKR